METESQYYCSKCQFKTCIIDEMRMHERSHGVIYSFGKFPAVVTAVKGNKSNSNNSQMFNAQSEERPKRYQCKTCDFKTDFIVYLKQHKCQRFSSSHNQFKTHLKSKLKKHEGQKVASSEILSEENSAKTSSMQESQNKTSPQILKCSLCSFQCKSKGVLKLHSSVHAQVLLKCTLCHFTTCFENIFELHKTSHLENGETYREYKCSYCPFVTTSNYNDVILHCLREHAINEEESEREDKDVSKSLTSIEEMNIQLPTSMTNFVCSLCSYKSNLKISYGNHVLTKHRKSLFVAIKKVLGSSHLPVEFRNNLTPEGVVTILNNIRLPKIEYKSRDKSLSKSKQTHWTLDEKKELYWCHIYAKCKLFSSTGFSERRRRMLEARAIMDIEKIKYTPEKRFHSMIANIKMGKTKITNAVMKAIEKDVEDFIEVKLTYDELSDKND